MRVDLPLDNDTVGGPIVVDWRGWLPDGSVTDPRVMIEEKPPAHGVPAMLKRRLTPVGRALCDMLGALKAADDEAPIVHASQHGDGQRPLDMLDTIADGEPVSPTRFSLSVHNALAGVYSIAFGHLGSISAISATGEEWPALIQEAEGFLAEGAPRVVIIWSDSTIPGRYRARDRCAEHPSAVAVVLERKGHEPALPARSLSAGKTAGRAQPDHLINELMAHTPSIR
ncbi:beta-ketoacyl synthase chain length factor [Larsenimonas salina]|uniref:beta-ketoacyl synthase chain length factor n=1 Tax=Larsenimonas salina TaxID=1295565 RepID=UPI0020732EA0|nr:beta-ketoacyl synthase chain length factor [Larsenimonas salina]MCM5705004.1 beta-ketoacyl synthase chain length factor [Larsenimonas salina]